MHLQKENNYPILGKLNSALHAYKFLNCFESLPMYHKKTVGDGENLFKLHIWIQYEKLY